jgi:raffinose/stachyose/melibiose transport system permease protein
MSAVSGVIPGRQSPGRRDVVRGRRTWLTMPASYLVILIVLAITLVPMLYLIVGGFSTTPQLNNNPNSLPNHWVWSNYGSILSSSVFWQAIGNSAIIAVVATGLAVTLGSTAAFALSRYSFRGREGVYLLFIAGLLFPANTAALPLFLLLQRLGLTDNLFGVALPEAAFSLPITILILRPFMRAVPGELEDAAVVDGATRIRFFLRILLPLSRPALITVGILAFVTSWNAYLLPLVVFTSQSHFTLPLAVATFQSTYTQDTARVFAFTALSMVPALAVFVFAQRKLVGGVVGAIRG